MGTGRSSVRQLCEYLSRFPYMKQHARFRTNCGRLPRGNIGVSEAVMSRCWQLHF